MVKDYANLLQIDFFPLSEAKAKLSEFIRRIFTNARRIAITVNGKPTAVLLSYQDYLELVRQFTGNHEAPIRTISFENWKRQRPQRNQIRDSITKLFDARKLSRKGQKSYKGDTVHGFARKSKKGSGGGR